MTPLLDEIKSVLRPGLIELSALARHAINTGGRDELSPAEVEERCDAMLATLSRIDNQKGGDAAEPAQSHDPAGLRPHVAPPASGNDGSGRATAERIAKGHIDTGFGEAMDELMASELADKIERALASEYERGVAAGERIGIEKAAKVAANHDGMLIGGNMDYGPNVGPKIATAIRALNTGEAS